MPFDNAPGQNEGHARLRRLADKLRGDLPQGFCWDYSSVLRPHWCGTAGCALGLELTTDETFVRFLGFDRADIMTWRGLHDRRAIARWYGITKDEADSIFFACMPASASRDEMGAVTPLDVAARIDEVLASYAARVPA